MAKSLFVFSIQSISDVITNSSSELFIFQRQAQTIKTVKELLNKIYPDWRTEYAEPIDAKNLKGNDLEWVMDSLPELSHYSDWVDYYRMTKEKFEELKKKEVLDELKLPKLLELTPEETYTNWNSWCPIRDDNFSPMGDSYLELSTKATQKIKKYIKDKNIIALFSLGDNPTWEKQEILMNYATRVHMG